MFGWITSLFATTWTTLDCGCKFRQPSYTPLECVECDVCRERRLAEARARVAEIGNRNDGAAFLYGPIADGHAASDCGGGDGGGGDGGCGGDGGGGGD